MDSPLMYALLAGIAVVVLAVICKAALRWAFRLLAVLLVLAALAVGTWLWFNYSKYQPQHERTPGLSRRTPAQH